jgi:invasion protein IalB
MTLKSFTDNVFGRSIASAILVSCVMQASPLFAEDASQPAVPAQPAAQTVSPPAAPAAPAQADATTPQPQAGQPAQPQVHATKFDNWYYRCVDGKAADGAPVSSCEVAQIATVKQGDQNVNVLTLAFAQAPTAAEAPPTTPAAGQKGAKPTAPDLLFTALVPLNMYLPAGLGIDAGNKPVLQLAYRNCNQAGCWAQQKLDAKTMAALQKNDDAIGHVQLINGQKVNIKFSLKGLSPALDALRKPASK